MAKGQKITTIQTGSGSKPVIDLGEFASTDTIEIPGSIDLSDFTSIDEPEPSTDVGSIGTINLEKFQSMGIDIDHIGTGLIGEKQKPELDIETPYGKEERINEINAEIAQKEREIGSLKKGALSELGLEEDLKRKEKRDEARSRRRDVANLEAERTKLERELQPLSDDEKTEIKDMVEGMKWLDATEKYGPDLVKKTMSEARSDSVKSYYQHVYKDLPGIFDVNKLDYSYYLHGKRDPIEYTHTSKTQADSLWLKIRDDLNFKNSDYMGRRNLIMQGIQKYVTDKYQTTGEGEGVDPEVKEKAKNELLEHMLDNYMFSDDNDLSNNGVQSFGHYANQILTDYIGELRKMQSKAGKAISGEYDLPEFGVQGEDLDPDKAENFTTFNGFITDELRKSQTALKYAQKIMKAPTSPDLATFGSGLVRSQSAIDLLSLGITEMVDAFDLVGIASKQQDGEELSHAEEMMMAMYVGLQQADQFEKKKWKIGELEVAPYNVSRNITAMLPYIATFVMSGGMYTATKGGTMAVLKKVVPAAARKKLIAGTTIQLGKKKTVSLAKAAATNLTRAVGAAGQTLALPQYYLKHGAARMIEVAQPLMFDDELGEMVGEIDRADESVAASFGKGFWEAYSEIFTERAGMHLMGAIKAPFKFVAGKAPRKVKRPFQRMTIGMLKKMKKWKTNKPIRENIIQKKMGWHGVAEEYVEELANYYMSAPVTGGAAEGEFWNQQAETFLTVAIFGGLMNGVQFTSQAAIGDNVEYGLKDYKGKKSTFKLPRVLDTELKKVFKDVENPIAAATAFINKHARKLNKSQIKGILYMANHELMENSAKKVVTESQQPEGEEGVVPDSIFDEMAPKPKEEGVRPTLTEEKRKQVEKANKEITQLFPDLVRAELLPVDPESGQMLYPDPDFLAEQLNAIDQELDETAKVGKRTGKIISPTEEIRDLQYKRNVLLNYLHATEQYTQIPWDDLLQSEKHEVLSDELRLQGKQSATLNYIPDLETFNVKLPGDRMMQARWDETIPYEKRKEIGQRMLKNETFTVKLDKKDEWDPENKFPIYNSERDENAPYPGDRIGIYDTKGKLVTFIGAAYVQDFAGQAKERAAKYKEIKDDIIKYGKETGFFAAQWLNKLLKVDPEQKFLPEYTDEINNEFKDRLFKLMEKVGEIANVSINDAISRLRQAIRDATGILDVHKDHLLDLLEINMDSIIAYLIQLKKAAGEKMPKITTTGVFRGAQDLRLKNSEAVALSGSIKVEENLKTFAPFWNDIAKDLGVSKNLVEKTFYELTRESPLTVPAEEDFRIYIDENKSEDRVRNEILNRLGNLEFDTVISLFDFYENVRLVLQVGTFINNGQIDIKDLNLSESIEEFTNRVMNRAKSYVYIHPISKIKYQGYAAIQVRLTDHLRYIDSQQHQFMEKSPEKRTEIRKEIFQRDLELLSGITGIPIDTWREYFSQQTKETYAYPAKDSKRRTNYRSYDTLLEHDTYEPLKAGMTPKLQSRLTAYLTYIIAGKATKVLSTFTEDYNAFMTQGTEKNNVFSNLYKLSTAARTMNDVGLIGKNIKDDQITSFQQYSHLLKTIEENGFELVIQNGMKNIDRQGDGRVASEMSLEDIWISSLSMFLQEEDMYFHNLGQFGDKPAIYYVKYNKIKAIELKPVARIPMKFADGTGGRKMRPEFAGKSTMDNILSGDRTATSRDMSKAYNRIELNKGDIVEFYDDKGMTALVEITKSPYSINEISKEKWSELETWDPSVYDRLDDNYEQFQFKLVTKQAVKSLRPELEEAVDYMMRNYVLRNQSLFVAPVGGRYVGLAADYEGETGPDKLRNMVRHFVHNYAVNSQSLNKIIHGNLEVYNKKSTDGTSTSKGFINMVKRAGSTNSPGYRLNRHVRDGVGLSYEFAVLNDSVEGFGEMFDGVVFMSPGYAQKIAKSMGATYYKPEENEILTSSKILASFVDPVTGNRALTKGNWLNIDLFAEAMPDSPYSDIQRLMKENNLDVLSFTSTNKLLEKGSPANVFNGKGRISKFKLSENEKLTRSTEDLYVQQDLRHPTLPKDAKMAAQFLANMLVLPGAYDIVGLIHEYQQLVVNETEKKLTGKPDPKLVKIDWILRNVNKNKDPHLWELLFNGMLSTEPSFQAYLKTKLSSELTKGILELPMNRSTTQEIPDPNGILKSRRPSADGKYILLPQAGVSFPDVGTDPKGVRYPQQMRSQEEAIQHIKAQKDAYRDLIMPNGDIMTWEVENGVIPGEPIMLNRIPADHPHSHTVARATIKIPGGNFTMLDKQSQVAAGSDFDGDYRFSTVFYKTQSGYIVKNTKKRTQQGIANDILYRAVLDYMNPEFDAYIRAPIDTKAYDDIVDLWRDQFNIGKYKSNNPIALDQAREANMTGYTMKGVMTDLNTLFSIMSYLGMDFAKGFPVIPADETAKKKGIGEKLWLNGIVNDRFGMMKIHIANLQNLAFDNAADPKIEYMGLNEATAFMYVLALISNKKLDSTNFSSAESHYAAIKNSIKNLSYQFNSPLYREFVSRIRGANGASQSGSAATVFNSMYEETAILEERGEKPKWSKNQINELQKFYNRANELNEIRNFFLLTRKAPTSSAELFMAQQLYEKISQSAFRKPTEEKKEREEGLAVDRLSLFRTDKMFTKEGQLHPLFAVIDDVLDLSETFVFEDSFEHTRGGKQIIDAVLVKMQEKHPDKKIKKLTRNQLMAIIRSLNNVIALSTYEWDFKSANVTELEEVLVDSLPGFREKYPDNMFLQYVFKLDRKFGKNKDGTDKYRPGVEILYDYRTTPISEEKLARIRNDYDKLPPRMRKAFEYYAIYRWGPTPFTAAGSYYDLMGDDFRVEFSRRMDQEVDRWVQDKLSPEEKWDIMELSLKNLANQQLRTLSVAAPKYRIPIDMNSAAAIDYPITYEGLETVSEAQNESDLETIATDIGLDIDRFVKYGRGLVDPQGMFDFTPQRIAELILSRRRKGSKKLFPQFSPTNNETKNMMPSDALGEALASEDPALQAFVFDHLSKTYPGVQFFTNRNAFEAFVIRNGGRMMDIDTNAIGHAFKNAVFIDPTKAVQSTSVHEVSHIYWDGLAEDDPTKEALRSFYINNSEKIFVSVEDLDEAIIMDLGRMIHRRASIEFKGSAWAKFLQLVRDFFRQVKSKLGMFSEKDILTDLSESVWRNTANVEPLSGKGYAAVRNMIESRHTGDAINGKAWGYIMGNKPYHSVSRMADFFKNSRYDPVEHARAQFEKINIWYSKLTQGRNLSSELADAEMRRTIEINEEKTASGTLLHRVFESVFGDTPLDLSDVKAKFSREVFEKISFNDYVSEVQELRDWFESYGFQTYMKEVYGYNKPMAAVKFRTEYKVADVENGVAATMDLIVDIGNNDLVVVDVKTANFAFVKQDGELDEAYTRTYNPFKNPLGFLSESKQNEHKLQLYSYKKVVESINDPRQPDQKNNVVAMLVVPVVRALDTKTLEIRTAYIPRLAKPKFNRKFALVEIMPKEKKLTRATNLMFEVSKKKIENDTPDYQRLEEVLNEMKLNSTIKGEMLRAYSFMQAFIPSNLSEITAEEIENIWGNGLTGIMQSLPDLGYEKEDMIGENAFPMEALVYAGLLNIPRDQIMSKFKEYTVKSYVAQNEVDNPPEKGYYWHTREESNDGKLDRTILVRDGGTKDLKQGNSFLRIYPLVMPSGVTENVIETYEVVSVYETHEGLRTVVKAVDNSGNVLEFDDLKEDLGVYIMEDPIKGPPEGAVVHDKFIPRYYYNEIIKKESHFDTGIDEAAFGADPEGSAEWHEYNHSRKKLWNFFKKYDTLGKMRSLLNDQDALNELYNSFTTTNLNVTGHLVKFLEQVSMNHNFADNIRRENLYGPKGFMPVTLELYYHMNLEEGTLYQDFTSGLDLLPGRTISAEYIPFTMMHYTIMNAWRRHERAVFNHDEIAKKYKDVDIKKMTVFDPNTKKLMWIKPIDPKVVGTREAEALEHIYEMYKIYDPSYRHSSTSLKDPYPKMISVKKKFKTRNEFVNEYGYNVGLALHSALKPGIYDNVRVPLLERVPDASVLGGHSFREVKKDGKVVEVTLKEIKDSFIAENLDNETIKKYLGSGYQRYIIRNKLLRGSSRSLLGQYTKEAKRRYYLTKSKKSPTSGSERIRRGIRAYDQPSPRLASDSWFEGESDYINKLIWKFHMKNVVGPLEYTLNHYSDGSNAHRWLKDWSDRNLYGISEGGIGASAMRTIVNFLMRRNSLAKIAFSIAVQKVNFMVGQAYDMIFEPQLYIKGWARLFEGPTTSMPQNVYKAFNILKRNGIVNLVDDRLFDELEKEVYILGRIPMHKIESWGYALMEWAEKANQFPLIIGMFTDEEWKNYRVDGTIIDPAKAPSDHKIDSFVNRVNSVHGDYTTIYAAPAWYKWYFKAPLQFRKWMFSLMHRTWHKHLYNRDYVIDSGFLNGLAAMSRFLRWNTRSDKQRNEAYGLISERVEAVKRGESVSPLHVGNLSQYTDLMIYDLGRMKISWKDMPENERKAFYTLVRFIIVPNMLYAALYGMAMLKYAMFADDDDEPLKYLSFMFQKSKQFLTKIHGDFYSLVNLENWQRTFEGWMPFVDIAISSAQFSIHLSMWFADLLPGIDIPKAYYKNETKERPRGMPKFVTDMFRVMAGGGQARDVYEWFRMLKLKRQKFGLVIPEYVNHRFEFDDQNPSSWDVMEKAQMYDKYNSIYKLFLKDQALKEIGIDPETMAELTEGDKLLEKRKRMFEKYVKTEMILKLAQKDPELMEALKQASTNPEKVMKYLNHQATESEKKVLKEFSEALQAIEELSE